MQGYSYQPKVKYSQIPARRLSLEQIDTVVHTQWVGGGGGGVLRISSDRDVQRFFLV